MPRPSRDVVIVEDDDSMRQAMHRMLKLAGFNPEGFESAEAALASPRPAEAACLVVDIQLPGLSGFDLFDRIVAAGTRPAVIFITGFDEPTARARAARRNAAAFLTKPFPGTALVSAVKQATGDSTPSRKA